MKKLFITLFTISLFVGCKGSKEYATISGKIDNTEIKELTVASKTYSKKIILNDDGTFIDTLKVEKGVYTLSNGKNKTFIFLANGYNLTINADANDFSTVTFKGEGEESNNYILERIQLSKSDLFNPNSYFKLEKTDFEAKIEKLKNANVAISIKDVDSLLVAQIKGENERLVKYLNQNYAAKYAALVGFAKGKPSPKFVNLENYKGGTTSLDDFKGKYVYIDVWATWCGPCKQQIPFLQKLEKEYHNKNIAIISISTDRKNKYEAWRKMIEDRKMSGIQLYAGEDLSFSRAYQINSIPRFILVDPDGNIVDANAPRPSDPRLKQLFDSLKI